MYRRPRHTIVTRTCCFGTRPPGGSRRCATTSSRSSSRRPARSAGVPLRDGGAVACTGCLRRLPWLRGHRCPRCALPRHRQRLPGGRRRLRPRVGAAGLRGRGARPRRRAEVPRRAAGRGADGGAHRREPARRPARGTWAAPRRADVRGPAVARAPLAVVPVPAHRGRRRRRGFDAAALLAAALAGRTGLPLAPCLRRVDRGRRQVGAGRVLRRSAGRFEAVLVARAAAGRAARRRRPHHGRDAGRLRAGAEGGRRGGGRRRHIRTDPVVAACSIQLKGISA